MITVSYTIDSDGPSSGGVFGIEILSANSHPSGSRRKETGFIATMTIDSTTSVVHDFLVDDGPHSKVFCRAQLEHLNPKRGFVVLTVRDSGTDRTVKMRLGVVGLSHTAASIAAATDDPAYSAAPVFEFHGRNGVFVDDAGRPLYPEIPLIEVAGIYNSGDRTGWFDIID